MRSKGLEAMRRLDVLIAWVFLGGRTDVHGRTFRRQVSKFGVRRMAKVADSWRIPYYTSFKVL